MVGAVIQPVMTVEVVGTVDVLGPLRSRATRIVGVLGLVDGPLTSTVLVMVLMVAGAVLAADEFLSGGAAIT